MSEFLEIIKNIDQKHGKDILNNAQQSHAILLDLAKNHVKERLLARHFVETGGYLLLKNAGRDYTIVKDRIIQQLIDQFSIEASAAAWITNIFAIVLGYEKESADNLALKTESTTTPGTVKTANPLAFANSLVVAIGMRHTVAVLKDGTVIANGNNDFLQCDVVSWEQIKAIVTGDAHTIGLMADGRVVATGRNNHDQCDVGHLEDIAGIYAHADDTICIRQDGTVVTCGKSNFNLSHFEQIHSITRHPDGVYGLRKDGLVMMSSVGWEEESWVNSLTDVVQIISTFVDGSLVLKKDGRVYKMGESDSYFAQLRDIISIVDLTDSFAVLRKDGKVRILPYDRTTPRKKSMSDDWHDITAIFGKYKRLIGLTDEGHLLATCTDPTWLKRNGSLDYLADWYPVGS
ncbi:MAG: hypothetical protein FWC91_06495 [Defluviitaleaceae bacterium]|nr:hypothetical protein [Defluviitaleaceae bacterium]